MPYELAPSEQVAYDGNFEFQLGDRTVFTGMQKPETMPLGSFSEMPSDLVLDLDTIADIHADTKDGIITAEEAFDGKIDWFNQGNKSSCNAYMIAWILSMLIFRNFGVLIRFSPEWVYSKINGGRDQGSMLDDGMEFMKHKGMPEYVAEFFQLYREDQFGMEGNRWAGQSASQHTFAEAYYAPCDTFENLILSLASCLVTGGCTGNALHVGNQYMRSGDIAGYDDGLGNHAVPSTRIGLLTPRPQSIEDIRFRVPGTWGRSFAKNGYTWVEPRHFYKPGTVHRFYCVTAVNADSL